MNITEAIQKRIVAFCEIRKITINQLSYRSGVANSTIKSIFYGKSKNPGVTTIKKICDGLDINITEFFDNDIFRNLEQEIK